MSVKKYLTLSGLTYFLNKIKTYLTSSTYLNSIGISNSDIDDIADDAGYSSGSLPASEDIFITGDIIPNTDNSVDLGASSKNIKMVYTKGITINGTQFLPSEFVKVTGNQTINGIKTFSNDIRISKTSPFCNVFSSGYIKGQAPTSNIYSGVRFFDDINSGSTNTITGGFEVEYNRDGYNKSYIASRNYAGENHKFFTVGLRVPNDDIRSIDFLPSVNGIVNLGTSTNKWANVYATTFNGNVTGDGALTLQSNSGTSRIYIRDNSASNYPSSVNLYSKIGDGPEYGVFLNGNTFHPNINNVMSLGSGNYKWAKVYSDDVVHTTNNETISGVKTFSDIPIVVNGKSYVSKINANRTDGTQTGFSAYNGFKIVCNNDSQGWDNTAFALHIPEYSPTSATVAFKLFDCIEGSSSYKGFLFKKNNNDLQFSPTASNAIDLGSSTNKWKSFNGINPGALSLPSISSTGANAWIVLDTTDWVKNTAVSFAQKYTPLADGWLNVRVDNATMLAIAVGGNYMHQVIRSETANSLALLMPVFKNTEVAIMTGGNENLAYNRVTFYYCQGNV